MTKLGLIVNPIAGMGGSVGLKGTDGAEALRKARVLGAQPEATRRAAAGLRVVAAGMPGITLLTCAGAMGEDAARECGMEPVVVGEMRSDISAYASDGADTRRACGEMRRLGVELLLFAGGDGTARDVCAALGGAGEPVAALGIPAGVKMHSAVFALTPRRAGETALRFLRGELGVADAEVMDIDEEAFRGGRVSAALYGYIRVPQDAQAVQTGKSAAAVDERDAARGIGERVVADMEEGVVYIIGPGTTTRAIADVMGIRKTLLGVDVALDGRLIAADANESDLLRLTRDTPAKIVVGVIGGQGYIFGRGNQQISARAIRRVIHREGTGNIIVAATRGKLLALGGKPLLVDTGDSALDDELSGYVSVITGVGETHTYRVSC